MVYACVAFLDAGIDAMRMASLIKPGLVTGTDRVDHKRVITIPMPSGVTVPTRGHAIGGVEFLGKFVFPIHPHVSPYPLILVQYCNSVGHGSERKTPRFENRVSWNPQWITCVHWVVRMACAYLCFG